MISKTLVPGRMYLVSWGSVEDLVIARSAYAAINRFASQVTQCLV